MGIYLNPEYENFRMTLRADIYVDKTLMIAETNRFIDKGNSYVCISRPRRFGKTIASEMLSAYYSKGCDSRELFSGLKIASDSSFEEKLNRYNVIKIDMNSEYQMVTEKTQLIDTLTREIKAEMRKQFPEVNLEDGDSLARSILRIYSETKETFILIIDEYDVLVREDVDEALFSSYLSFLNGLFKSAVLRPAIALAYLTGILPVVRDKIQSKLNNFHEYTILEAYNLAEYIGFTSGEVEALCSEYGMDFEECKNWYDGYSQHGFEIYNPESVVMSMTTGKYGGYWGKTSTYEAIAERIRMNLKGTKDDVIRMIAGESIDVNVTGYLNTMDSFLSKDDVWTYLIYIGYLAYDAENETCRIPNREVRREWLNVIAVEEDYSVTNQIVMASKDLLKSTIAGDEAAVAEALDKSHIHVTSNRSYNNEDALQSAIYLAYLYALNEYTAIKEMTAGRGFADIVYTPLDKTKPALIIELKRNGSADGALQQIRKKQYFESLSHFKGDLLLVGINYDEKEKTHTCKIERMMKE